MLKERAEIGDMVRFVLNPEVTIMGRLLHVPSATGDSWIIREVYNGQIIGLVYIQQFQIMRVIDE